MVAARRPARKGSSEASYERMLVEAAQVDPSKFEVLYELHFERVYFFVLGRVRQRATAEDVTSEVFHKALANLSGYEWRGTPFGAWLFRIATNAIADHYKAVNRERPSEDEGLDPAGNTNLSAKEMQSIERQTLFARLVEALPEIQRQVVCERFVEERSIKEIAERLGKNEGAVKQLHFRALQTLREKMGGKR